MILIYHFKLNHAPHVYVVHGQTRFPPGHHQVTIHKYHHVTALVRPLVVPIIDGYSHLPCSISIHGPGLRSTELHHHGWARLTWVYLTTDVVRAPSEEIWNHNMRWYWSQYPVRNISSSPEVTINKWIKLFIIYFIYLFIHLSIYIYIYICIYNL